MKKIQTLKNWLKVHKKELLVTAGTGAAFFIMIAFKNKENCLESQLEQIDTLDEVKSIPDFNVIQTYEEIGECSDNIERNPIQVREHVRNLHIGWNPSPEKIEYAARNGYQLLPRQTIVESYVK